MYSNYNDTTLQNPSVWMAYNVQLSRAYYEQDSATACRTLRRALKKSRMLGELDPALLSTLENLARHYHAQGDRSSLHQLHSSLREAKEVAKTCINPCRDDEIESLAAFIGRLMTQHQ